MKELEYQLKHKIGCVNQLQKKYITILDATRSLVGIPMTDSLRDIIIEIILTLDFENSVKQKHFKWD